MRRCRLSPSFCCLLPLCLLLTLGSLPAAAQIAVTGQVVGPEGAAVEDGVAELIPVAEWSRPTISLVVNPCGPGAACPRSPWNRR